MIKLEFCPFCGTTPKQVKPAGWVMEHDSTCILRGKLSEIWGEDDAKLWNTRYEIGVADVEDLYEEGPAVLGEKCVVCGKPSGGGFCSAKPCCMACYENGKFDEWLKANGRK